MAAGQGTAVRQHFTQPPLFSCVQYGCCGAGVYPSGAMRLGLLREQQHQPHRARRLLTRPLVLPLATLQNKKNTPERMELMKYNKYLRRMTVHKEIK